MSAYLDTGALVPLYVEESLSEAVTAHLESRGEAVSVSLFHQLELENALRLKVFRSEIQEDRYLAVLSKVETDMTKGMLVSRPVSWVDAFTQAREISQRVTATSGCRTLDLIHVAIAMQWECSVFVTADGRQAAAARLEGLSTVDLRDVHRRRTRGRAGPGAVRERHRRYRAKKAR